MKDLKNRFLSLLQLFLGISLSIFVITICHYNIKQKEVNFRYQQSHQNDSLLSKIDEYLTNVEKYVEDLEVFQKLSKIIFNYRNDDIRQRENIDIIKPFQDNRNYQYLTLKNNITVLLIQTTQVSAGAILRIDAGSSYEPQRKLHGLAHLLEHIMYNGNPVTKHNTLTDILSKYDGFNNAMTNDLYTQYYFTINYKHIREGLEKWADAFINLDFSNEDIKREMLAVNSEYQNTLISNNWRFQELVRRMANPDSQFIRCSIGTEETLNVTSSEYNLHDELFDFYQKYYTPQRMSLIIASAHTMSQMEQMAIDTFGKINRQYTPSPHQEFETYPKQFLGKFVWFKSISHGHSIRFVFPIPKSLRQQSLLTNPFTFLSSILESEHEGGFVHFLRNKNYINGFNAHGMWEDPPDVSLYYLNLQLTSSGFEEAFEIIEEFFSYVKTIEDELIADKLEKYYKNQSFLSYIKFYYEQRQSTSRLMQKIMQGMKLENKQHMLLNGKVSMKYDKEYLASIIQLIEPNNSLIIFESRDMDISRSYKNIRYKQIFKKEASLFPEKLELQVLEKLHNLEYNESEVKNNDDFYTNKKEKNDEISEFNLFAKNEKLKLRKNHYKPPQVEDDDILRVFKQQKQEEQQKEDQIFKAKQKENLLAMQSKPISKFDVPAREVQLVNEGGDLVLEYMDHDDSTVKEDKKVYYNGLPEAEDESIKQKKEQETVWIPMDPRDTINGQLHNEAAESEQEALIQHTFTVNNKRSSSMSQKKYFWAAHKISKRELDYYDEFEKFYFTTDQIKDDLLNNLNQKRKYGSGLKVPRLSNYVPSSLSIVSKCQKVSKELALKSKFSKQQSVIQSTTFTESINDMINQKSQNYYDPSCFDQELEQDSSNEYPIILKNDTFTEVWHKSSRDKMLPMATSYVRFQSPHVFNRTSDVLCFQIMKVMYENSLSSEISEIDMGGSTLSIEEGLRGLTIFVSGYSDVIKQILLMAVERIKNRSKFITQENFVFAFHKLQRSYKNAQLINSQEQTDVIFNAFLRSYYHYPQEMLESLNQVSFSNILEYYDVFIKDISIKSIFLGNVLEVESIQISQQIVDHLQPLNEVDKNSYYKEKIIKLKTDHVITIRTFNQDKTDSNHACYNYYQIGKRNLKDYAVMNYIENTLSNDAFTYLRDQQHLGYIANAGITTMHQIDGLYIYVQGGQKDPTTMDEKIEEFWGIIRKKYENMSDREFPGYYLSNSEDSSSNYYDKYEQENSAKQIENLKSLQSKVQIDLTFFQSSIESLKSQSNQALSLNAMSDKYWNQISKNQYDFQSHYNVIKKMYTLKKQDIMDFFDNRLIKYSRKLSIQVFSQKSFDSIPNKPMDPNKQYSKKISQVFLNTNIDKSQFETFKAD